MRSEHQAWTEYQAFVGWTRNGYWRNGQLLNEYGQVIYEPTKLITSRTPPQTAYKAPGRAQRSGLECAAPEFVEWLRDLTKAKVANIPSLAELP